MKASEFIVRLQEAIETYGDLEIMMPLCEGPKLSLTRVVMRRMEAFVLESNDGIAEDQEVVE